MQFIFSWIDITRRAIIRRAAADSSLKPRQSVQAGKTTSGKDKVDAQPGNSIV